MSRSLQRGIAATATLTLLPAAATFAGHPAAASPDVPAAALPATAATTAPERRPNDAQRWLPQPTRLISVEDPSGPVAAQFPRASSQGHRIAYTGVSPYPASDRQVYLSDVTTGRTVLVSATPAGAPANAAAELLGVSGDGRCVVFASGASDLVPGDTNGVSDVFIRDVEQQTTSRVSVGSAGLEANGSSTAASVSYDGRYVAFDSRASNLVPGDSNGRVDVFVRDRQAGTTTRVSVDSRGRQARTGASGGTISPHGRTVAFSAPTLTLGPGTPGRRRFSVYVRDLTTGRTELVSVDRNGGAANGRSNGGSLSADGRFVVFNSLATDLVTGEEKGRLGDWDVFIRDRRNDRTRRVSRPLGGGDERARSSYASWDSVVSLNGRFVTFTSNARRLVRGDTNGLTDAFVWDRLKKRSVRVSITDTGVQTVRGNATGASITADGRAVVFATTAALTSQDTDGGWEDVYLRQFR